MKIPTWKKRSAGRAGAASGFGAVFGVGLLGALAILWWRGGDTAEAADIDPARVVVVERRDVLDGVNASGRIEPLARVAVMSRASGIVEALFVDEGDVVTAGQVLAELDREQLEAQWNQDQADLLAAEARVEAAEARLAETRVRVDDPELEFLERDLERVATLFEQGRVSAKDRDDAQRALEIARFRVAQVKANLPVLEASIAEAAAQLAAAEADLERSATALREATIKSPIDGIVLLREKEVGDGVSSILTAGGNATQLMTLGDLSEMYVEARVDEVDLGRIHVGMPAQITVDAFRGAVLEGEVRRIAPAGTLDDNGIVTFEVEVTVKDPEGILRPDMTADAKLVIERRDDVPALPQVALRSDEDGTFTVDRVVGEGEEARLERVVVKPGISDGLMTEVLEGLEAGDRVLLPIARRGGR